MKIEKVFFFKTYPNPITGNWEKVGVEGSLQPGEDARSALYEAKKTVENFHYESNGVDRKNEVIQVQKTRTQKP